MSLRAVVASTDTFALFKKVQPICNSLTALFVISFSLRDNHGKVRGFAKVGNTEFRKSNGKLSRALVPTFPARSWLSEVHGGLWRIGEFSAVME